MQKETSKRYARETLTTSLNFHLWTSSNKHTSLFIILIFNTYFGDVIKKMEPLDVMSKELSREYVQGFQTRHKQNEILYPQLLHNRFTFKMKNE